MMHEDLFYSFTKNIIPILLNIKEKREKIDSFPLLFLSLFFDIISVFFFPFSFFF
uniref:Uncharacterized protein n=1 Tax=Lepeophtheirus salmonis TaxID=72036 RepID=A0A0K2VLB5_LEPSM